MLCADRYLFISKENIVRQQVAVLLQNKGFSSFDTWDAAEALFLVIFNTM